MRRVVAAGSALTFPPLYVYGKGTHNWPGAQGDAGIARAGVVPTPYLR